MIEYSNLTITLLSAFLIAILGIVLGQICGNIVKRLLKGMEISKILEEQLKIKWQLENHLSYIIRYIIYFVTLIIVLNTLGIPTRVLQIVFLVLLSIIIIFIILAFKDWLPNLVSGFYILRTEKIKIGDVISTKGIRGRVVQINLLETKIETNNNEVISIPNHNITRYELMKEKK